MRTQNSPLINLHYDRCKAKEQADLVSDAAPQITIRLPSDGLFIHFWLMLCMHDTRLLGLKFKKKHHSTVQLYLCDQALQLGEEVCFLKGEKKI